MAKETVFFNDTKHELELAPINLVFNTTTGDSYYPDRLMIDITMTIDHFNRMTDINPYTAAFFKLVVPDFPHPITIDVMKRTALGFRHLIGLFDLSLNMLLIKKPFGWKYPETGLHPKYQGNLADALIVFSNPATFAGFIESARKSST
jgi:hypothetical protein